MFDRTNPLTWISQNLEANLWRVVYFISNMITNSISLPRSFLINDKTQTLLKIERPLTYEVFRV